MTDKSQFVSKMNQPAGNGHHGASNSNAQGQQKFNRNDGRGNRAGRGKEVNIARGREKVINQAESDGNEPSRLSNRNMKRGRLVNDIVNFEHYQPTPKAYNYTKSQKHVVHYVKEDYVHVSCQFVVDENSPNISTVIDSCVDWQEVIQVRLPCEELSSCPICLYPPVCPLTPACGHAMCYSCALRFQDNCPGGDCPICHKPLILSDFRPLKTFPRQKYSVGDEIVMKLVSRSKDGKIVCPISEGSCTDTIPNLSSEWGSQFCHVITATNAQILHEVLLPQENELKTQLTLLADDDEESKPYVLQALQEVSDVKHKCYEIMELSSVKGQQNKSLNEGSFSNNRNVFFYQCADGQAIFIHPLNSRCLIQENGNIEACPPEICCKIVAMEHYTQSPELRSRYRYFSHLSLGCPFILCEVEIRPFISQATYDQFKVDLDRRSKTRQVKERKENAYTAKLSKKLAEKEVTYRCSASLQQFTNVSKPASDHFMTPESYDLLTEAPSSTSHDVPLSFAEKLSAGTRKNSSPLAISPPGSGVWGRPRINSTSSELSHGSETSAPSYQHSFSASINDAFASLDVTDSPVTPAGGGRQGKKKKNKGKTISLTGGARRC